eukprot:TRINITY_DN25741_c0_g1_i1.p1 TRINITY_DN25741_c0_g1~~TRINITY_DN25741_c0_g1_i1.p1  ORF type:complete len:242 (-),score=70.29 TRINITY_DN25741_c0_g1_i1:42-767(-)
MSVNISLSFKGRLLSCEVFEKATPNLLNMLRVEAAKELDTNPKRLRMAHKKSGLSLITEEDFQKLLQGNNKLQLSVKEADADCSSDEEEVKERNSEDEEDQKKVFKRATKLQKQFKNFSRQNAEDLRELKLKAKMTKKLVEAGHEDSESMRELRFAARILKEFERHGCQSEQDFQELKRILRVSKQETYACPNEEALQELKRTLKTASRKSSKRGNSKKIKAPQQEISESDTDAEFGMNDD